MPAASSSNFRTVADIRDQDGPDEAAMDSNRKRKSPRLASKMTSKMSGNYPGQNIQDDEVDPDVVRRAAITHAGGSFASGNYPDARAQDSQAEDDNQRGRKEKWPGGAD